MSRVKQFSVVSSEFSAVGLKNDRESDELKISRVVHSISDLDQLQAQILELIFEVVPAERGAILLDGKGNEKFSSLFAYPGPAKGGEPVSVSHTIIAR